MGQLVEGRLAVGRLAVGRLAVGRLVVGRLAVRRLVLWRLAVERLVLVGRFEVVQPVVLQPVVVQPVVVQPVVVQPVVGRFVVVQSVVGRFVVLPPVVRQRVERRLLGTVICGWATCKTVCLTCSLVAVLTTIALAEKSSRFCTIAGFALFFLPAIVLQAISVQNNVSCCELCCGYYHSSYVFIAVMYSVSVCVCAPATTNMHRVFGTRSCTHHMLFSARTVMACYLVHAL